MASRDRPRHSTGKTHDTRLLATRLKQERAQRSWSIAELAERSSVSRAMISKVERGEASPTAALLGRLSGAFGLTLSTLLARAESSGERLSRAANQERWTDPETGYVRRACSPRTGGPLELVAVELPSGARVRYPASAYAFTYHQILVLSGSLRFQEGPVEHLLRPGDCLELGAPAECTYANAGPGQCRYLVAVVRR
jgi:transcriptional regulator with XRE-family HTH domain